MVTDPALAAFRRHTGHARGQLTPTPFTRRERWVLTALLVTFNVTLWYLGGITWRAHLFVTVLAGLCLVVALLPLRGRVEATLEGEGSGAAIKRLLTFPPFWLGLALLGYLLVQWLNPHAEQRQFEHYAVMAPIEHIGWLPQGIRTPMQGANPLRSMLILGFPWLISCALWVGLRSRRAVVWLFAGAGLSLVLWTGFAYLQYASEAERIMGIWRSMNQSAPHFWGTMPGTAHAGYLMALGVALFLGLFLYYLSAIYRQTFRLAGPHWLYLLGAGLLSGGILTLLERGSVAVMLVLWVVFLVLFVRFLGRDNRSAALTVVSICLLFLLTTAVSIFTHTGMRNRLNMELRFTWESLTEPSKEPRYYTSALTWDMLQDRWIYGWGAGAWRYYYPRYKQNYPDFNTFRTFWYKDSETGRWKQVTREAVFFDAHNDLLQYPTELGLVGVLPLAGVVLFWGVTALRRTRRWDPATLVWLSAAGILLLLAAIEFYFRNPIVHLTYALVLSGTVRRLCLEHDQGHSTGAH